MKALIRRILPLLCCLQFCCALYLLQLRRGRVCWYDARSGVWHETNICADALSRSEPETGASPDGSIHRESPRSSEPNAEGRSVGLAGSARYSRKQVGAASPRQFGWYREAPSSQRDEGEFYSGGVQHV